MKHHLIPENLQRCFTSLVFWCLLIACLGIEPAAAQITTDPVAEELQESVWKIPDLAALPPDWWSQFNNGPEQERHLRVDRVLLALDQRTSGLIGTDLITAQDGIGKLRSLFELLELARLGPVDQKFDPPLVKETYFPDDLFRLRAHWRELEFYVARINLQVEQAARHIELLQDRRDKLVEQYAAANSESPSRILLGIKRIAGRLEYELALARTSNAQKSLKGIEAQKLLVTEQQAFARSHLVSTDKDLNEVEATTEEARRKVTKTSKKMAALQLQLLEVLSADEVNLSLELLRKQQLTKATVEMALSELQESLAISLSNWYHFRADKLDSGYDVRLVMVQSRRSTSEALRQADLWSSTSQSTLIAPVTDTSLNTVKNIEIAQSVAHDTLALVDQIRSTADNLLLIQDILTREIVADTGGIENLSVRLGLAYGNSWDRLVQLAGYHLFNIGDATVTPSGIVKMLVILALAIGISWLIRYLLARGLSKKETAQSPAYYALGRILHYIIVMAGSFAALSSIGIDFTSFALIAGALSVGIGFGLQAIVSNFVSGLILLFEGTLRVGDYIELDSGLCGVVREINTRATVVNTNDSVDVVVPNTELVTTKLTNWTLRETVARVRIPFGVAYGSDKELVRRVALEAVKEVGFALTKVPGRAPQIRLTNFGDSALEFDALIWVSRQGVRRPQLIRAEFLWALETIFRDNNIEIPFPQRDVHVRSDFRDVEDQNAAPDPVTDPSHV